MLTPHPLSGRAQDSPTATGSPGAPEGDAESGRAQRLSQLPDAYDLEALDRRARFPPGAPEQTHHVHDACKRSPRVAPAAVKSRHRAERVSRPGRHRLCLDVFDQGSSG